MFVMQRLFIHWLITDELQFGFKFNVGCADASLPYTHLSNILILKAVQYSKKLFIVEMHFHSSRFKLWCSDLYCGLVAQSVQQIMCKRQV